MPSVLRLPAIIAFVAAVAVFAPLSRAATAEISAVRLGLHPEATRVVVELSAPADYRVYALDDPPRMVMDFADTDLALPENQPPQGRGLVVEVRVGRPAPGVARVTLDLAVAARLVDVQLLDAADDAPLRLVVDLAAAEAEAAAAEDVAGMTALPDPPDQAPDAGQTLLAAAARELFLPLPPPRPELPAAPPADETLPLIVIDAGHGGIDPGAIGPSGVAEKDITLAMARELRNQLEATGSFRVLLTRDDDRFIRLRDRFEIAREHGAALFVSLHADSHKNPLLRGASVYTLSENASDAEAAALAAKENKSDLLDEVDLSEQTEVVGNILLDLRRLKTLEYSVAFAKDVVEELERDTLLLRNTHRSAGFAVLKAPDIPSVLVELGYLSNESDESLLQSRKHRAKLGKAITRAIEDYFTNHPQEARLNAP